MKINKKDINIIMSNLHKLEIHLRKNSMPVDNKNNLIDLIKQKIYYDIHTDVKKIISDQENRNKSIDNNWRVINPIINPIINLIIGFSLGVLFMWFVVNSI